MKKKVLYILAAIFTLFAALALCAFAAFDYPNLFNGYYDNSYEGYKVVSRVYKSELPVQATNEEIAKKLVERMMNKHLPGNMGWSRWVWKYEIKKINLPDGLPGSLDVVIYVKPFFADEWANFWTFEVDKVEGGWVRVGYYMGIDDKGNYYELSGPFSGG